MKTKTILFSLATILLFSCEKSNKSTAEKSNQKTITKKNSKNPNDKKVFSKYVYADSDGKNVTIENSLPKGGMRYTDAQGRQYVYAVFWTRIANETSDPLEIFLLRHWSIRSPLGITSGFFFPPIV